MNGIERLRDLVAAGEKATQGEWWVGDESDEWGWGRICAKDVLDTARLKSSAEVQDEPRKCVLAEFNRYIRQDENHEFVIASANARQALSDVLALVEAVRRLRTTFAPQIIEGSRHSRRLLEVKHEFDVALAKLTSADAQEGGE